MSAKIRINSRVFVLSWDEFLKCLERSPLTSSVEVIDII